MSVKKRGNKFWIDFTFKAERHRLPSPINTLSGAKEYESFLRLKIARGEPIKEKPEKTIQVPLFSEFAVKWLNLYVRANIKPSEASNRKSILMSSLIPFFGKKKLDQISSVSIEEYKMSLLNRRLSPKTINNYISILSKCLKTAVEWDELGAIPKIKQMKVPPQKFDYLSIEESELILRTAQGQWRDMILLALRTGLRFGEIAGLKWDNIDYEQKMLTVIETMARNMESTPKNNKPRSIPLTSDVIEMLQARERTSKYVFCDKNGKPLQNYYCARRLREVCDQAGIRYVSWHKLRHTFASRLGENNQSVMVVKELLGHADIKTTMRYVHTNTAVMRQAIETLEPTNTPNRSQYGHNPETTKNGNSAEAL